MKKILSILATFGFPLFTGFNMIACINQNDDAEENSSVQSIKTDLQLAKQFLSTNQLTIDTIFANENTEEYINYLKSKHQDQIRSEINFLFNENEFVGLGQGDQQVLVILNHHEENATIKVKFTILPDVQVASNILNKAETELQKNISAVGLLATSSLNQETINKIINLVENQISNNNVQVAWSDNGSLKALQCDKENKVQVELSVKSKDNGSLLASKIVDVTLVDVSDSIEIASQNLLDESEQKLSLLDGEGLSENDDLSSSDLRQEITDLLTTVLNNPQISINLLTESGTLKENNNEVKVKLTIQMEEIKPVERDITVTFSNIISSQKHDNIIVLKEKIPEILKSVDGSSLPADFSVNNSEVWKLINKTINDSNVKISAPPILKSNIITIEEQLTVVSNDLKLFGRAFGRSFGRTVKSTRKVASRTKTPIKKTVKRTLKVKKTKSVDAKKNQPQRQKNNTKPKNESNSNTQTKNDSSKQAEENNYLEQVQEKMEQAEELFQSYINQLVATNVSAKLNDYNIFALATVGIGENAVSDIVPVKFINVTQNN